MLDVLLSENGSKKLEAIERLDSTLRQKTVMPGMAPVNG